MSTTPKYWFKPKTYGYGANPSTWQGWVATIAAAGVPAVLAYGLLGGAVRQQSSGPLLLWLCISVAIFAGFLKFARAKTDGEWKWRWKGRDYDQK